MRKYSKLALPLMGTLSLLASNFMGAAFSSRRDYALDISCVVRQKDTEKEEKVTEERYIEEVPPSISLEQLIKDSSKIFPEADGFFREKNIVLYATAEGDWCQPCREIEGQDFWDKITNEINGSDVGIAKVMMPAQGDIPKILKDAGIRGVPDIRVYENNNGTLNYVVSLPDEWGKVTEKTLTLVERVKKGDIRKPEKIELGEKDFRNYSIGFSIEDEKDLNAIVRALTLFRERTGYDKEKEEVSVNLDLSDWRNMAFALAYDYDNVLPRNTNRNVLGNISDIARGRLRQSMKEKEDLASEIRKTNDELSLIWQASPEEVRDANKWKQKYERVHRDSWNLFAKHLPSYFTNFMLAFDKGVNENFSGEANAYLIVLDEGNKQLKYTFGDWADEHGKNVDNRVIAPVSDIRRWGIYNGVPEQDVAKITDRANKIREMYSALQKEGVAIAERWMPSSPVLDYLRKYNRAVILREEHLEDIEDRTLLDMFVSYATTNDDEKTAYVYLPRDGRLGGINMPPNAAGIGAYLTDFLINGSYSPAIYIGKVMHDDKAFPLRIENRILLYEQDPKEKLEKAIKRN